MKVKEMIEKLDLKLLTKDVSEDALYAEVEGGYASDLLSNAMGQGQTGMVWRQTSRPFLILLSGIQQQ